MATNKELYDESSRKTYNNIDSKRRLMYVEATKNKFAGYRPEMLVYSLSELETDFYVCTECKGVMRNACLVGEEQNYVCEVCVKKGVPSQSMVKSRNKILELQTKCPIATRGCNWNGKMAEVEEHLTVCDKMVVKCNNACDVILPRCELDLHLTSSCVKRRVMCGHCNQDFMFEKLTNHYQICLEYEFPCPNNCNVNLKRKLLDSHLELECPNMVVDCPYKKFGCRQEVLRRELEEHKKTNRIQHLESKSIFADREMEELKQTNIQQTETIKQQTKTNIQLIARVTTLENEVTYLTTRVERLLYPIILSDHLIIPTITDNRKFHSSTPIKVIWKFLKISVEFTHYIEDYRTSVFVRMENDDITQFVKWPFEGRFKLTTINDKNEPTIYESDFKGRYPSEFLLAWIPPRDLQNSGFLTPGMLRFTLQIQEIENQEEKVS